tara:strand:+ start:1627 stop:1947 length:321 start_codon:yes stop_codon:yes gene_type:complete
MDSYDKKAFKEMLDSVMTIYSKQVPDQNSLRIWWSKLEKFSFKVVAASFDTWVQSASTRPTPYDILILCRSKSMPFAPQLPKPKIDKEAVKLKIEELRKKMGWNDD